jgi:Fe-S-cluster containining protein
MEGLSCRAGCGACCIAPSISSAIPGMPEGKPAGIKCIHLDDEYRCRIFHDENRPSVCASLLPNKEMCGDNREEALSYLNELEQLTKPET